MTEPLSKVDSAVDGVSPTDAKETKKPRQSTVAAFGVEKIEDLVEQGREGEIKISPKTQVTGWKVNTSPNSIEEPELLKVHLTDPPLKKIDLHFPLGLEVTARNLKGVTIKDAMDAIHKKYKKSADDELEAAYLKGFEYDTEESKTRFVVHLTSQPTISSNSGGGKKKKNKKGEE